MSGRDQYRFGFGLGLGLGLIGKYVRKSKIRMAAQGTDFCLLTRCDVKTTAATHGEYWSFTDECGFAMNAALW